MLKMLKVDRIEVVDASAETAAHVRLVMLVEHGNGAHELMRFAMTLHQAERLGSVLNQAGLVGALIISAGQGAH